MTTYLDANTLVRLYLNLPGGQEINSELRGVEGRRGWPFAITDLLRLEFTNAIYRMVFESHRGGQWRVTPEAAACALADYEEDLQSGVFLRRSPLTLADIESEFTSLAARYTMKHGFRTYDLLHVSSALTMRCRRFRSFDAKANRLAELVGMETL